ncbi:ABC-F family ATP-binding cassette domain-containing protein [Nonomuraea africana]|uniref:Macrolide transport system ATP-binding/permease protein n=1 Tax=Nonomuraea africana TaxID=46171 RepID=A0ABR9KQF3_9ACTN|nr:TlrC/CarA/OleB/SrmB family ABC-F type ribosomal protection protein [Nonomuraea africana]MBE1564260.1 macrolide transport system ATP-binding/permease protein [Nonomuraea africana]
MRAAQIALSHVSHRYADRVVLDQVSFTIKPGEKVGVIGDNGSGKSTLLRLLAGRVVPANGSVTVSVPGGIGYLPQTLELPGSATVQDAVDLALAEIRELAAEMRAMEASLTPSRFDAYAELIARFEARGGYTADARVDVALHGLGLPDLARSRRLGTLSGGERSRLALAATLASAPELLLLDEPTNDLDDSAVSWLEDHLRGHRGTVIVITHDRVFLERITSTILEVDLGKVRRYGNGYTGYLAAKAAERAAWAEEHEEWKSELARHEALVVANAGRMAAIPRKMAKAGMGTGSWRARSRVHGAAGRIRQSQQRVEWLHANPVPPPPEPLRFTATPRRASQDGRRALVELDGVRVGSRLWIPSFRVEQGERLLVTGLNGAGKTTLLRVLAGLIAPDAGTVRRPARIGYLRQESSGADPRHTVLRAYAHGRPGTLDDHADALLALGLFRPAELGVRVGALSVGQRRRIELARVVSEPADLLLLDEPTNHLSPLLVGEMEEALAGYSGAVVMVTHDRGIRAAFSGTRLELARGEIATRRRAA